MIYFLFIIFALVLTFVAMQFIAVIFRGYAPFVSSNHSLIETIAKDLTLKPTDVVYELGAGDAPLLLELSHRFPNNKYVGLENAFFSWLLGQIQLKVHKSKIILLWKNFYKVNISEATHIYCYLNVGTMKKLEEKFKAECKPGTIIISHTFKLPSYTPTKTINIEGDEILYYKI